MGTFKVLDHTADVGIRVKGASLSDLFETSALAMLSIEYDTSSVGFERELDLTAEASDWEGLLAAWLSEIVFIHDAHGFVIGDAIVVEIGETPDRRAGAPELRVRGVIRGRQIGDWFIQTGPQIKAVTLHEIEVITGKRKHEATFYIDV